MKTKKEKLKAYHERQKRIEVKQKPEAYNLKHLTRLNYMFAHKCFACDQFHINPFSHMLTEKQFENFTNSKKNYKFIEGRKI